MLADTTSKLSACLTNVELLTEFAFVFIYDVRRAEFRNLILELELIPHGVTVREDHLKRYLGVEVFKNFFNAWFQNCHCRVTNTCFILVYITIFLKKAHFFLRKVSPKNTHFSPESRIFCNQKSQNTFFFILIVSLCQFSFLTSLGVICNLCL